MIQSSVTGSPDRRWLLEEARVLFIKWLDDVTKDTGSFPLAALQPLFSPVLGPLSILRSFSQFQHHMQTNNETEKERTSVVSLFKSEKIIRVPSDVALYLLFQNELTCPLLRQSFLRCTA